MRDLRIVFMGTPDFAVAVLQKLVEEGKNIVGVITSPDKPSGRGRKVRRSPVKEYALSQNLHLLQPNNLKNVEFLEELKYLNANLQIIVAFRMLPKIVWGMPKYGTFNLHASLLPQYRGAAPINWVLINGESITGVTTFFIDEKIDTGETILKKKVDIATNDTAGSLHDTLVLLGRELVLETILLIEQNKVITFKQPQVNDLKEAPKLNSENTKIIWNQSVQIIYNFIRGLNPYPTAWSILYNNKDKIKVKIYDCTIEINKHPHRSGTIFTTKKELKIAATNGYIYIKVMQLPGKQKMEVKSLLNGYSFSKDAKML
ncbi:MAG: methionyl-tRNA formyltransferase [Bacteroidetes bacterium]|nr:methionyl-tRNA formyltransferase [Bacteroidota bacterium]